MTKGPIVIVEDDVDDQEIYSEVINDIGIPNEIKFFNSGALVLEYLTNTEDQPFIIISDINMPQMTGLQLKKCIQDDPYLVSKGIPFVFISTDASKVSIRHAHALSVQGFFQKPHTIEEMKEILTTLFTYWERCKHINNTF
jgi:CheY-like chemotaxis protein